MDGAELFLGYVAGGKPSNALREAGGVTTLETAFKAGRREFMPLAQ